MQNKDFPELRNCPFCGEKPDIIKVSKHSFFVECKGDKCTAVIFTHGNTLEQAAEKWNRRSDDNCTDDDTTVWIYKEVRATMTNVCSACGSCSVYPGFLR